MMKTVALDTNLLVIISTPSTKLKTENEKYKIAIEQIIKFHGKSLKICILDSVRREFLNDTQFDERCSELFNKLRDDLGVTVQSLNRLPAMIPFALLSEKDWELIDTWKREGFISDKDGLIIGCALQQQVDFLLTIDRPLINNIALKKKLKEEKRKLQIMLPTDYLTMIG